MRLAVLIQCHKNPQQINEFIKTLSCEDIDFYIHVDKKSEITTQIVKQNNVFVLPDKLRVDVRWGMFSQVEATLKMMEFAHSAKEYQYYWLVSGQDFPLASPVKIIQFLTEHNGNNFLNLFASKNNGTGKSTNYDKRNEIIFPEWIMGHKFRHRVYRRAWVTVTGGYTHTFSLFKRNPPYGLRFYFGSQWICLENGFLEYVLNYVEENPEYVLFYKKCSCPDESFFQTLLMNSAFSNTRHDYLHYIDWSEGKSSPKTLTCEDLDAAFNSGKLMARKVDSEFDNQVIPEMKKRVG